MPFGQRFVIANRNQPVAVAVPVEDFKALLETLCELYEQILEKKKL